MDDLALALQYVQSVGGKVSHTNNGGREWKLRCPLAFLHPGGDDSDPSAFFNDNAGTWCCYGCGASGGLRVGKNPFMDAIGQGGAGIQDVRQILTIEQIREELHYSDTRIDQKYQEIHREKLYQLALLERQNALRDLERDGIMPWAVDHFGFGYAIESGRPAISIPWTVEGQLTALQWRYLDDAGKRYKFQHGSMPTLWNMDAALEPHDDTLIVVEGAKKAATLWSHGLTSVVAVASKNGWKEDYKHAVAAFGRTIFALDPDALAESVEAAQTVPGARVARLPEKPDDFLVFTLGGDVDAFWRWLDYARPVR